MEGGSESLDNNSKRLLLCRGACIFLLIPFLEIPFLISCKSQATWKDSPPSRKLFISPHENLQPIHIS